MKKIVNWIIIGLLVLIQSCGFYGQRRGASDWHRLLKPNYELPPYSKWVSGLTFCLDPGHGGDAHIPKYKRGPTGVREAEMNLRVAFYLKDFLEKAGVTVILTRDADTDISLKDRAEIANRNRVDMFISLHHNAVDNPKTNFASTWYHGDADFSPVSLDLARYIQMNLNEYLRLPDVIATGLLSDYLMYPEGFGVLRQLEVPGILLESSFFSNPKEEKLLDNPKYNKIEAYAIFIGICQWAAAGIPDAKLLQPQPDSTVTDKQPMIRMRVSDGHHERKSWMLEREQIFSRSVAFFLDDTLKPATYLSEQNLIVHRPEYPLKNGQHAVRAEVTNFYGNHNLPKKSFFRVASPAMEILATPTTDRIPADGKSRIAIEIFALDSDGQSVADEDLISVVADRGKLNMSQVPIRNGKATVYLDSPDEPATAQIVLRSGKAEKSLNVSFVDTNVTLFEGRAVAASDLSPVAGAIVTILPEAISDTTNADGYFFFPGLPVGEYTTTICANGFWGGSVNVIVNDGKSTFHLYPLQKIANGVLQDFVLVIDPAFGGKEKGAIASNGLTGSDLNLRLAEKIGTVFTKAGANVYFVRQKDETLSREKRIEISNRFPEGGYFLRLNFGQWNDRLPLFAGGYYAGSEPGRRILTIADSLVNGTSEPSCGKISVSNEVEIQKTNRAAISMDFNWLGNSEKEKIIADESELNRISIAILTAFLKEVGKDRLPLDRLNLNVTANDTTLTDVWVTLGKGYSLTTNNRGACCFEFLSPGEYEVHLYHPKFGTQTYLVGCRGETTIDIDLARCLSTVRQ
ncbi:MAG: N-acetylmuramoyl-L-alanine amidase [Candidatus Neomarinimicrobiota bacterium]